MELIINGHPTGIPDSVKTVEELLLHLGLQDRMLVVELDQTILEKAAHPNALLSEGNKIEIVHFVGGG